MKRVFIITIMLIFCTTTAIFAHAGRTDSDGGHNSPDGYHYHHGYGAHSHDNGVCPFNYDDKTKSTGRGTQYSDESSDVISLSTGQNEKYTLLDFLPYIIILVLIVIFAIYKVVKKILQLLHAKRYERSWLKELTAKEEQVDKPKRSFKSAFKDFFSSYAVICVITLVVVLFISILKSENIELNSKLEVVQDENRNFVEQNDELQELADDLSDRNSYIEDEIEFLKTDLENSKDSYGKLLDLSVELKNKSDFLDRNIALVTETGKKYHTYGCSHIRYADEYYLYTVDDAEYEGYTSCAVCH